MRRVAPAALVLLAVLILSCGGDDDDAASTTGATGSGIATATPTVEVSVPEPKPTEAPTPDEISVANEPISVETPDGVTLQGHLYAPAGPKRQALIIVAPVEQSIWAESTQAFTSEGVAVFTFDPRGFGETGGDADAAALADDTALITRFVMSREYPLVYLLGAGEEAGGAVADAATSLGDVTGVATYGYTGASGTPYELQIAPDAAWSGEDVLADETVRDMVLTFVLGAN